MPHYVTHRHTQTVKGVKFDFRVTAPVTAKIDGINKKLEAVIGGVEQDPDQLGLEFEGASAEPAGEDDPE